ncbi:MAG TPA: hydroxymethylbilane synthase [Thermoanaerobaculia bacterium]
MTAGRRLRIGTRGSELALWQANEVSKRLLAANYRPDIVIVKTTGDKRQDVPLSQIGGKGMFVKELEEALDRDEIDLAVHSLKDVPSLIDERFVLAGYVERADARDVWVDVEKRSLAELPPGSIVGTSSPRRRAQLGMLFPLLKLEPIRGNVDSRIRKVRDGHFAGIVLASAGLKRLGRESDITGWFTFDEMLPAAGQGIVAIETLQKNVAARQAAEVITHLPTALLADCERGVLQRFGRRLDCMSSIAVHATIEMELITIRAFASDYDGIRAVRAVATGRDPQAVVDSVYSDLIAAGAMELLCPT